MDWQPGLVYLMPYQFLPGLATRGESSGQKLSQERFRLSFRVNDSQPALGDWDHHGAPFYLCARWSVPASPDEIPYYSSNLGAHPGAGVLGCCYVPRKCEQHLVCHQYSARQGESVIVPADELALKGQLHFFEVQF